MANFKQLLSQLSKKKQLILWSSIACILLIIIAYFIYKNYLLDKIKPNYVENKEFINKNVDSVELYFFYTDWCPHCKSAKPIWEDLKNTTTMINNVKINYIDVNCEKEKELAEKFSIEGYPTIKLVKDNQVIEYDAKPEKETLILFLNKFL
tara:strand:- start:295 stop:747 length:453 start_codon:yes stop_codon:yes gene_type:complete